MMSQRVPITLGIVNTLFRFGGGILPEENGKLPRDENGTIRLVSAMEKLCDVSPVRIESVQIMYFPSTLPAEVDEMVAGFKALGLEIQFVIMVGGANPMDPADEDAIIEQLVPSLRTAIKHGAKHVSSTSIEEWMNSEKPRTGDSFQAAIDQTVKVHLRALKEADVENSCIENWHIEFLRPGEFTTFTNIESCWSFVKAANLALGRKFFKVLVDAAHCGDSGLSIAENQKFIADIGASKELGIFHASAKTTRGCLSTDDGWIGALLTAAAKTGELKYVFAEIFDHEDPVLEALRNLDPCHGVDTRDGRSYAEVMSDGLVDITHRLNNLGIRGILQ